MFVVVEKNGDKYGIKDTTDGVVEYRTYDEIVEILKLGINIQYFSENPDKDYNALVVKNKVLRGCETLVLTKNDTKDSARSKILNIPQWSKVIAYNESDIKDMSALFYMSRFDELDLSQFDTSKVVKMNEMFSRGNIRHLNLTNFNTSKVRSMKGMFNFLTTGKLNLSSFDTRKVTNMNSMFKLIESDEIILRSFDLRRVTDMSGMFSYSHCSNEELDLSNFVVSEKTRIDGIFENCKSKVILPKTGKLA